MVLLSMIFISVSILFFEVVVCVVHFSIVAVAVVVVSLSMGFV